MNIKTRLLAEHSKQQTDEIVNWIGSNQQRFDQLFTLFTCNEYRLVQRAAWPFSYAALAHPSLVKKHFSTLIKNLQKPGIHEAVKRNTLRFLEEINIPVKHHGTIMNLCFEYISAPTEKAAIKAYALTILKNLSVVYPEIKAEIKTIIEERWPFETPSFKVRARLFLKELMTNKKH